MRCLFFILLICFPAVAIPRQIRDTTAPRWKAQPPFYVPLGATNVALRKPVTSSDDAPILGDLKMVTDGDKECTENHWVELGPNTQWVQIDLQKPQRIFGVQIWHYFGESRVYRDVIVQLSDDPGFIKGVRTVFNNDDNDSSGFGVGKDREYFETRHGQIIDTRGKNYEGIIARYVRLYSKGNTSDPTNHYIEVEVIGKAPEAKIDPKLVKADRDRMLALQEKYFIAPSQMFVAHWDEKRKTVVLPPQNVNPWQGPSVAAVNQHTPVFFDGRNPKPPLPQIARGSNYMQIDLGRASRIYGLSLPTYAQRAGPRGWPIFDYIVVAAGDGTFTKNVRLLFDGNRADFTKVTFPMLKPVYGLVIDFGSQQRRGVDTRFIRIYSRGGYFQRSSSYWVDILGVPLSVLETPGLMRWETPLPPVPYT